MENTAIAVFLLTTFSSNFVITNGIPEKKTSGEEDAGGSYVKHNRRIRHRSYNLFMEKENSTGPWNTSLGEIAVYSTRGRRRKMEDRYNIRIEYPYKGFAVYDGHGGDAISTYAAENILSSMITRLRQNDTVVNVAEVSRFPVWLISFFQGHFLQVIRSEILRHDNVSIHRRGSGICGTTALIGIIHGKKLYIANVGDSRAVVKANGTAKAVTKDHKPNDESERRRIENAGGTVRLQGRNYRVLHWQPSRNAVGSRRDWDGKVATLAVSRAIGDSWFKQYGVTAEPDVFVIDYERWGIEFLIMATDGLWDVFSDEQAVAFIERHINTTLFGADAIAEEAMKEWSLDNITVMIVKFPRRRGR